MVRQSNDETLSERLDAYYKIIDKYVPKVEGSPIYEMQVKDGCLEALAYLDGDEGKFKRCLNLAKKRNRTMGWTAIDSYNAAPIAREVKTLAYIISKEEAAADAMPQQY